jgi:hypothetical protein
MLSMIGWLVHYIFNFKLEGVIEDPESEVETIQHAWKLCRGGMKILLPI